ncbi:MAG: DUF6745 domain-containing protein [Nostoc sp.]|uniref:DUF6745 domain-containing protein n=1 Tax=unclassified Nostoc TaxID=2593658 RepID=UPI0025D67B3A|nr:hypothetical protein [Nostoc sp. NMS9]MBN3941445.1 hypothetical protein [Nostoc sp. NMS9]
MINSIFQEQEKLMLKYTQQWLKIGLKTEQIDYQKIKTEVNAIYSLFGIKQPEVVLVSSPYEALKKLVQLDELSKKIGQPLEKLVHKQISLSKLQIKVQLDEELWFFIRRKLLSELIDLFLDKLEIPFWNFLEEELETELGNKWDQLISLLWIEKKLQPHNEWEPSTELYCNSFSSWANISEACICDFCISVLNCEHNPEEWKILKNLINYCGWIFPYENVCLVSSRPSIIRLDEQNNFHGEGVPAIQFTDGFSVYANHGTILLLE